MRVILLHKTTGLFFVEPGQYTSNPSAAMDAKTFENARALIHREKLEDIVPVIAEGKQLKNEDGSSMESTTNGSFHPFRFR